MLSYVEHAAKMRPASGRWAATRAGHRTVSAMFERFTDGAQRIVMLAHREARTLRHGYIGTEHFLIGLVGHPDGIAAEVLAGMGLHQAGVRGRVEHLIGAGARPPEGGIPFTPRATLMLNRSQEELASSGDERVDTEHLLAALVRDHGGGAVRVLRSFGIEPGQVLERVLLARRLRDRRRGR